MPEKSKKSGEYGEIVTRGLLKMIGWKEPIENVDIKCHKNRYHQISEHPRKTHGIDFIYNYESQLVNNRQECNVISSKYEEKYSALIPAFKSHVKDIAFAIQCFPYNDYYKTNVAPNIDKKNINGIIFWLSRSEDECFRSIYGEISSFRNSENIQFGPIISCRQSSCVLLYSVITDLKNKYNNDYYFVYQTTGNNINAINRQSYGKILPVEMITSPLHIIKSSLGKDETLNIYLLDSYNEEIFGRLITLSRDLTEQWASKIVILFKHYDKFSSENSVKKIKLKFSDKNLTEKIHVSSFNIQSFRKLEENK